MRSVHLEILMSIIWIVSNSYLISLINMLPFHKSLIKVQTNNTTHNIISIIFISIILTEMHLYFHKKEVAKELM